MMVRMWIRARTNSSLTGRIEDHGPRVVGSASRGLKNDPSLRIPSI